MYGFKKNYTLFGEKSRGEGWAGQVLGKSCNTLEREKYYHYNFVLNFFQFFHDCNLRLDLRNSYFTCLNILIFN